jgi:hypothetical protein
MDAFAEAAAEFNFIAQRVAIHIQNEHLSF